MNQYCLSNYNKIYLNSFHPLCINNLGRKAVEKFGHPPYIDASCRREPDLENKYPSISAICRQHVFAPRLQVNDVIVYMSVKRKYDTEVVPVNKLISILKVVEIFKSHKEGYDWYRTNSPSIPSNCIVDENPPYGFEHTAGNFDTLAQGKAYLNRDEEQKQIISRRLIELWDRTYKERIKKFGMLVRSEPIYVELFNPVSLTHDDLKYVFDGKTLNTRNPPSISLVNLQRLAAFADLNITAS